MRNIDIGVGLPVVYVDHRGIEIAALVQRVHDANTLNLVLLPEDGSLQHAKAVKHENIGDTPFWRYCMEREEREARARATAADVELARRQQLEDAHRSDVAHEDRKLADQIETAHEEAQKDAADSGDRSGLGMIAGSAADTVVTDELDKPIG